jgi:hypothetical protein
MRRPDPERETGRLILASMAAEGQDDPDDFLGDPPAPIEPAIPQEGWIAESVRELTKDSMIAPEFALATSVACVAAAAQGAYLWNVGASQWGTGLWIVCLASAGGRKTSALAGIAPLEELASIQRLQTSSTSESLAGAFEESAQRWMAVPEFAALMNENEKTYMLGVRDTLNGTWDGGRFQTGDKRRVGGNVSGLPKYATTTIVGMATMSHFAEWAASNAIQQGFLTRVIFLPQSTEVAYSGLKASRGYRNTQHLYLGLKEIRQLAFEQRVDPKGGGLIEARPLIDIRPEAADLLDEYDQKWTLREDLPPTLEGFAKRLMPNAVRIAWAHALAQGHRWVEAGDAELAIALMEYSRTWAWPLIERFHGGAAWQGRLLARLENTMDRLATRTPDGWVREHTLKKNAHLYGVAYEEALQHLIDTGTWDIKIEHPPNGGRPLRMLRCV